MCVELSPGGWEGVVILRMLPETHIREFNGADVSDERRIIGPSGPIEMLIINALVTPAGWQVIRLGSCTYNRLVEAWKTVPVKLQCIKYAAEYSQNVNVILCCRREHRLKMV